MEVKVKKIENNAVIPYKSFDKDFCYDVVATSCEEIAPNIFSYGIGLAFEINRDTLPCIESEYWNSFTGYESIDKNYIKHKQDKFNLSIDLRTRSSIWKTGLILCNCVGTIDELYRGEVRAIFYKVVKCGEPYKVGDRIGQIKLGITLPIEFVEVDNLSSTNRGEGGFGSTGK